MLDVLSKHIFTTGDVVYCVISPVDKPHLFIKCMGTVKGKRIDKDNIVYDVHLRKLWVDATTCKQLIHRRMFKVRKLDSGHGQLRTLYCLQHIDASTSVLSTADALSNAIVNDVDDVTFNVAGVFTAKTEAELHLLYDQCIDVMRRRLKECLTEMQQLM